MIIDADVHISPTPQGGNSISAEVLIDRMDEAAVDKAIVWVQPPYVRDWLDESQRYIYESSKRFPGRFLSFGWVDPNLGFERGKETAKRCVEEYGCLGVKLNGAQNTFYIDDPDVSIPLVEEIAKYTNVIALHCGADVGDFTHPYRVGRLARQFPELQFLMVHMGGASFADFSHAAIEETAACPNISIVGSAIRTIPLINAIRILGSERIAFGSDTPFELMWLEILKYKAILEKDFSETDAQRILGGNIATLLNI